MHLNFMALVVVSHRHTGVTILSIEHRKNYDVVQMSIHTRGRCGMDAHLYHIVDLFPPQNMVTFLTYQQRLSLFVKGGRTAPAYLRITAALLLVLTTDVDGNPWREKDHGKPIFSLDDASAHRF